MTQNDYLSTYYGDDLPDDMRGELLQALAGEPVIGSPDVTAFMLHEMGFDDEVRQPLDDVPEDPEDGEEEDLLPADILAELKAILG